MDPKRVNITSSNLKQFYYIHQPFSKTAYLYGQFFNLSHGLNNILSILLGGKIAIQTGPALL